MIREHLLGKWRGEIPLRQDLSLVVFPLLNALLVAILPLMKNLVDWFNDRTLRAIRCLVAPVIDQDMLMVELPIWIP